MRRASAADWSAVEPSIFGTLLVRALTPEERHRLGAEYTPRAFIERLVRPTVEEPVPERWTAVQAEVLQLMETKSARAARTAGKDSADAKKARRSVLDFHEWLRGLQILDPACGSGNFLYVTMHSLKRVEVEVFRLLSELSGKQLDVRLSEIDPSQFHGIEVKAWAREIAELTLWIGFHQFWRQQHGDVQPDEPLLRETGTLEHRDAVLAWDSIRHVPSKDRLDPTPRIVHPVTGKLVPDLARKLKYFEYVGARAAEWPAADFIVGNPPYLGEKRQRDVLGDGYVDALRSAYPKEFESVDLVTYWWHKAAALVAKKSALSAGLITTNSLTQSKNRFVIEDARLLDAHVVWAIANHPWVDDAGDADVRVTMTVVAGSGAAATLLTVDENSQVTTEVHVRRLNSDLTSGVDVPTAARISLAANLGLSSQGYKLVGSGFVVEEEVARRLLMAEPHYDEVLKPFRNGRDLSSRPRNAYVVDFGLENEAYARSFPVLYERIRDLVMPERVTNPRESYARLWWRFAEPRRELRAALSGLRRCIVTLEVSKYRFFAFLTAPTAADGALVAIALSDEYYLGILSSRIHVAWSLAAGGRLGVGNDPRYTKSLCFDPFPFPDPPLDVRTRIADVAERLDAHRKAAIARDESVTMTGMYNIVAKLRSGDMLTPKERAVHEIAACGVLRDLHDELDGLVADAYGWPRAMSDAEILDRLVALHDVRVAEEAQGLVRWLRPEFQAPDRAAAAAPVELALTPGASVAVAKTAVVEWPAQAVDQIGALKRLASAGATSIDDATRHFQGAKREIVARHLETLEILGELRALDGGRYAGASVA